MRKRITAVLVTAVLTVSMTCLSFAAITPHLSINIDPTDATYTLTATAEGAGDNPTYQWYECGANGENPVAVEGATGNVYEPVVANETKYFYCQITNGSESANTEVASITDTSASKKPENQAPVSGAEGNMVSTFAVDGIEAPVTGEIPDQTATIVTESDSPGFYILSVQWDTELPTFIPDTAYTATVLVNLSDGFRAAETVSCFIDGNPATIVGDPATGSFSFYYTFPPTVEKAEPVSSNPVKALWEKAKDKVLELPAPLGIPAWIWGLAVLILLIALISAITAHSRARKYERNTRDYLDELYEETMAEKQAAERMLREEEYEEAYEDIEEAEAEAEEDVFEEEADAEGPDSDDPAPQEHVEDIYNK